jgi:hypothetical protein
MEEVMGKHGLNTVLNLAGLDSYIDRPPANDLAREFDFAYMTAINEALEEMYGARGGRGMALRIGRASFSMGMKDFGAFSGMRDPAFKLLSQPKRLEMGLRAIETVYNRFSDQDTRVEDGDEVYYMEVEISPMSWGRITDRPVDHALVGITQEALRYASLGFEYHVQQIACRASGGDSNIFRISKTPTGPAISPA